MTLKTLCTNSKAGSAIALTIGVGLALGNSLDNYLIGILLALPLGVALYRDQNNNRPEV